MQKICVLKKVEFIEGSSLRLNQLLIAFILIEKNYIILLYKPQYISMQSIRQHP